MNAIKEYLKWSDFSKVILSMLLVYWIYVSVGWAVTVFAILFLVNDMAATIVNRIKLERENRILTVIEKLSEVVRLKK